MIQITKNREVHVCKEFEPFELPMDILLHNGKIDIYAAAAKYFDLDYRGGKLVIAPKSFVGLIPVNDRVAIHVIPRFRINNLFYLINRSSTTLRFIEGYHRSYLLFSNVSSDPLETLADKFSSAAAEVVKAGILRKYCSSDNPPPFSGSLDISLTVTLYRSQGIRDKHAWATDELTENIIENAIIKYAAKKVLGVLSSKPQTKAILPNILALRRLLAELESVSLEESRLSLDEFFISHLIRNLPIHNSSYASLIWLSYLIIMRKGLTIESGGQISFDTFVVSMADIFEAYTRTIIQDHFHKTHTYLVRDGNKHQANLFVDNSNYKVKPDIYILKNKTPIAVLDAKYKPDIKPADRYEIIAFCEALHVKLAVVISPAINAERILFLGRTPSGIEFWQVTIDLSSDDILNEECLFISNIESLVTKDLGGEA